MTKTRLEAWAPYPQSDKHRRAREKEQIGKEWTRAGTLVVTAIALMIFCLAFVSIGLETNFRLLQPFFKSGKPMVLYVCGQTLNLILTLIMAYLMFEVLFPSASQ